MPFSRFTVLSLLGSIPWVLALAFAGHALGGSWTSVRKGFQYVDYAILALIVVGILYAVVRRRRSGLPHGGPETIPSPDAGDGVG
jgi:membrane protein DedA with SNARE-associated domain